MAAAELLNPTRAEQTSIPRPRQLHAAQQTLLPDTAGRWSLRVDLKDDEIARLYAQGLTRGALVWRSGMPEWRPLLITPELSRLLHSTPIKLRDVTDPALEDEVTLPRPGRLPSAIGIARAESSKNDVPTVAPMALDAAPAAAKAGRRSFELLAVATLGFALAWFARGDDEPQIAPAPVAAAVPPAAPVSRVEPAQPSGNASTLLASSSVIPTVSLTDLPLLGSGAAFVGRATRHASARRSHTSSPARASSGGPTRAELQAALNQVASVASGCGERGGPVRVVIAFAPSGVARSIQVSGKELPSQVRSCIIGAASRARVASFSGDPVTVAKTL
jgi:hypothetical protein